MAVGGHRAPGFVKGADIGWSTEYEATGKPVGDADGQPKEMTALMKDYGCQAIRCRVWLDPEAKGHGRWCNKEDVLEKCRRAKALGMDVMIDFHYSDWWCDPAKQPIPLAWQGMSLEEMKAAVGRHTKEVLTLLRQHGITPRWVQVGNETTYGLLWSVREDPATGWPLPGADGLNVITEAVARMDRPGKTTAHYASETVRRSVQGSVGIPTPEQLTPGAKAYAEIFRAGYEAVKSVCPKAQVIVHLDDGFDHELFEWNLGILRAGGAKWDIIGMSLYTYWAINEGKRSVAEDIVDECMSNIVRLNEQFGTPSMLVEVGMDALNPDEGARILKKILREAQLLEDADGRPLCLGAFYWEPACRPSQYRLGAFDETGRPTVIMDTFRDN